MRVSVQQAPFDMGAEAEAFASGHSQMGAVVTFTGVVRDADAGGLAAMEIEHYPGMTEKAITKIAEEARQRKPFLLLKMSKLFVTRVDSTQ